jgi:hypothetical protein
MGPMGLIFCTQSSSPRHCVCIEAGGALLGVCPGETGRCPVDSVFCNLCCGGFE